MVISICRVLDCYERKNMKIFLAQVVFVARNDDFEGWMQILVVVIMVVVYGLSGILKAAKSKKFEGKKDQPAPPEQPVPTVAIEPQSEPQLVVQTPQLKELKEKIQGVPDIKPELEKLSEFISPSRLGLAETDEKVNRFDPSTALRAGKLTIKGLEDQRPRAAVPMEISEVAYLGKPLIDVSDPQALRRAILHYEILGKPLSLRDSGK